MTVSAIILAAGEGTRMRSEPAQTAAPDLWPADGRPRRPRAREAPSGAHRRRRRPRRRARHQEGARAGAAVVEHRVRRAGRATWHRRRGRDRHGRAAGRRLRRLDRRRAARRHAVAASRDARRAGRHARRQRERGDAAHQRDGRPDRLRPRRSGRPTGGCCESSNNATRRPTSSTSARSARASTRSGATSSAPRCATSPPTTPNTSSTSPT